MDERTEIVSPRAPDKAKNQVYWGSSEISLFTIPAFYLLKIPVLSFLLSSRYRKRQKLHEMLTMLMRSISPLLTGQTSKSGLGILEKGSRHAWYRTKRDRSGPDLPLVVGKILKLDLRYYIVKLRTRLQVIGIRYRVQVYSIFISMQPL